ncbi:response regulator transcription factor [Streptomyces sp. B5E4]|uniref:response regulator transcription factor n=1 Tax=Streptomyces sp. B5E4 TaxID=3153568 RepID=UPI00325F24E7
MEGREVRACTACYEMTVSFLIDRGVTATAVEVRRLPDEAGEGEHDDKAGENVSPRNSVQPSAAPGSVAPPRKNRLLLIEDDENVSQLLCMVLNRKGYAATYERDGQAGLREAYAQRPDVVLLDLGLPDMDGSQLLHRLRAVSDVPVIVVTARNDVQTRVHLLNTGADDYLVKPFHAEELIARIERVLHRHAAPGKWADQIYDDGLLRLDSLRREASVAGVPLMLTPTEFRVLDLLVRNTGVVQSLAKLLSRAWDEPVKQDTAKVKFAISRLRRKLDSTALGSESIVSARGVGYFFRAPAEPTPAPSTTDGPRPPRSGYGHAGNVLRILESRDQEGSG